jgi:hypothetical protein
MTGYGKGAARTYPLANGLLSFWSTAGAVKQKRAARYPSAPRGRAKPASGLTYLTMPKVMSPPVMAIKRVVVNISLCAKWRASGRA